MSFLLGLTGSIGMGKSTTAQMFRDAGVPVWDADETVHQLYAPGGAAVAAIGAVFPAAIVENAVSRPALKALMADDPAVLPQLEALVHPLVAADRQSFVDLHDDALIVFDIPLLFETGADRWLDAVLVVSAPAPVQAARVLARAGMSQAQFDAISARQMPDAEKRARADFVIETIALDQTRMAVMELISQLSGQTSDA